MELKAYAKEWYKNIRTVRDLIDNSAAMYGDKTSIKYCRGDEIVEKSFKTLRENSLAICRYIRSVCPERMHIAVIGKTTYEYITATDNVIDALKNFVFEFSTDNVFNNNDMFEGECLGSEIIKIEVIQP